MTTISQYNYTTADWRRQLAANDRKTKIVIAMFIGIYIIVGFLIDIYLHPELGHYTLWQITNMFIDMQVMPYGTLIFGGVAVVSVLITYALHDKLIMLGTDYHEVTQVNAKTLEEKQLYNVIEELKVAAGMRYMPKIFIIEADYMNAFASGYSEKSALVAITCGLLRKLERDELQAVMAHELSHIRHHDIKLTLMATVLSNLMLIAIDFLFYSMLFGGGRQRGRDSNRDSDNRLFTIVLILRYLLPLLTVLLLLYLSRTREYMADAGAVELTRDNSPLAKALLKISQDHAANQQRYAVEYNQTAHEGVRRAAYIFDPVQAGIKLQESVGSMFSTHPAMKDRLKALGFVKQSEK